MDEVKKRVVITGMGALSPIGLNVAECWANAVAGRSGIRRITLIDPTPFTTQIAGEVWGFDPGNYLDRKVAARIDRYTQGSFRSSHSMRVGPKLKLRCR